MRAPVAPLVLNGSYGEGGGALLRTALTVSAMTQQPVRVHNVRGALRRPGLTSEDLTFLKVLEQVCAAEVTGADLRSNDVTFSPTKNPHHTRMRASVTEHEKGQIPGNALVILESLLPVLAKGNAYSKVIIEGETYNNNTINFDAFERVTLAMHRRQGLYVFPVQEWAGFGFGALGEVGVEVEPSVFQGLQWGPRGNVLAANAVISYSEFPRNAVLLCEEMIAKQGKQMGLVFEVESKEVPSKQSGLFITTWVEFDQGMGSGGAMAQRGQRMENAVSEALSGLADWYHSDTNVDPYLADQMLIPAIFAEQPTTFTTSKVTRRLQTMAWVIKEFLPIHVTVLGREGEPGTIKVSR